MTRKHGDSRPIELQNNQQGFRYRLGVSVVAWCIATLTLLMFMPGKLEVLSVVITPQSTLLGAVVLGLLGIKGYQDYQKSSWSRRHDYDDARRSTPDPTDDCDDGKTGGRGE